MLTRPRPPRFAYAYTIRTFALESFACLPPASTERHAAAGVVAGLLPFLVDKTTDVFDDVGGATDSVVGHEHDLVRSRQAPTRPPPTHPFALVSIAC